MPRRHVHTHTHILTHSPRWAWVSCNSASVGSNQNLRNQLTRQPSISLLSYKVSRFWCINMVFKASPSNKPAAISSQWEAAVALRGLVHELIHVFEPDEVVNEADGENRARRAPRWTTKNYRHGMILISLTRAKANHFKWAVSRERRKLMQKPEEHMRGMYEIEIASMAFSYTYVYLNQPRGDPKRRRRGKKRVIARNPSSRYAIKAGCIWWDRRRDRNSSPLSISSKVMDRSAWSSLALEFEKDPLSRIHERIAPYVRTSIHGSPMHGPYLVYVCTPGTWSLVRPTAKLRATRTSEFWWL